MTLPEIIAALEAADGPDWDLNAGIARALGWELIEVSHTAGRTGAWKKPNGELMYAAPFFTASLDAALTLVPDDANWGVSTPRQPNMSGKRYWASLHGYGGKPTGTYGATPAIALCIAALKARSGDVP